MHIFFTYLNHRFRLAMLWSTAWGRGNRGSEATVPRCRLARSIRLILRYSAVATIVALAAPAASQAVIYGDNASDACTGWTAQSPWGTAPDTCTGWTSDSFATYSPWSINFFTELRETLWHNGQDTYERIFIPYDALGYYNTSTGYCDNSPAYTTGGSGKLAGQDWSQVTYELRQIKAASDQAVSHGYSALKPLIVLSAGTGIGYQGATSMSNGNVPILPDASNSLDVKDFACGVDKLIGYIDYLSGLDPNDYPQVTEYEAFNEPDAARYSTSGPYDVDAVADPNGYGGPYSPYNGNYGVGCSSTPCSNGEWKAAYLWYVLQAYSNFIYRTSSGAPNPLIAAYVGTKPNNNPYFNPYLSSLGMITNCWTGAQCAPTLPGWSGQAGGQPATSDYPTSLPSRWSVHDYLDPTAGWYTGTTLDLQHFENNLASQQANWYNGQTSSKVWVTESGVHLDEGTTEDDNTTHTCKTDEITGSPPYGRYTFGGCVDANPSNQQAAANTWLSLGAVTGSYTNYSASTTELLWYQFQLQNSLHSWDSALLDAAGNPRPAYCTITGWSGSCNGRTDDYMDAYTATPYDSCPDGAWVAEDPNALWAYQCY